MDAPEILGGFKDLPEVKSPTTWKATIHKHAAKRAGLHYDLRLAPGIGQEVFSWAIRHWPEKPGEKRLAVEQPIHDYKWLYFSGEIKEGYGAGKLDILFHGDIDVLEAGPGYIKFVLHRNGKDEYYFMKKMKDDPNDKNWLIINYTPKQESGLPLKKPKMKVVELSKGIDEFAKQLAESPHWVFEPKLDGIHSYIVLEPGKQVRVFARPRKPGQKPSEYTFKIPELIGVKAPRDIQPMIIRAETAALKRDGKGQFDVYTVNAILHRDDPLEARRKAEELGAKLVVYPFDLVAINGKPVEDRLPYEEKLNLIKEVVSKLPDVIMNPIVFDRPSQKKQLLHQIGKKPLLEEGLVAWNLKEPQKAVKIKRRESRDVYIREITIRDGEVRAIGYSSRPGGPVEGRVNAVGLPKKLREAMAKNPERFKDLCIIVSGLGFGSSLAMRHPVIEGVHIEKSIEAGKQDIIQEFRDYLK